MPPDSPHQAILDAVEGKVLTLDLDGLQSNVQRRLAPEGEWMSNLSLPAVVISGAGSEAAIGSDSGDERLQYPVEIRLIWRHPATRAVEAQLQKLRRRIRLAFQSLPLAVEPVEGLLEVFGLTMTASPVVEVDAQAYQLLSSRLDFQAHTWEER